ncbi:MAG TPA: hypothetical protein VMS55_22425 [Myxococcota bacterium]|nr:hypothetical protein [Myxococcota bacterium]
MRRRLCALVACAAALAPAWAGAVPRIAILPLVVHSAASDPAYLSDGLADMLAARLEQIGGMRVMRDEDAKAATTRLEQAVERGGSLSVDYVVFGSFTQFGDGASLDLQCAPVKSQDAAAARTLFVQSGAIGEIIPKLDDVADKIAYYVLGETQAKAAVGERARNAAPLRDLLDRVDALERTVYGKTAAPVAKETQAPAQKGQDESVPVPPPNQPPAPPPSGPTPAGGRGPKTAGQL